MLHTNKFKENSTHVSDTVRRSGMAMRAPCFDVSPYRATQ